VAQRDQAAEAGIARFHARGEVGLGAAKPFSMRPSERSQSAVRASDTWTCQLPPSARWRSSAAWVPNASRNAEAMSSTCIGSAFGSGAPAAGPRRR
jgi:hypothetical protein